MKSDWSMWGRRPSLWSAVGLEPWTVAGAELEEGCTEVPKQQLFGLVPSFSVPQKIALGALGSSFMTRRHLRVRQYKAWSVVLNRRGSGSNLTRKWTVRERVGGRMHKTVVSAVLCPQGEDPRLCSKVRVRETSWSLIGSRSRSPKHYSGSLQVYLDWKRTPVWTRWKWHNLGWGAQWSCTSPPKHRSVKDPARPS